MKTNFINSFRKNYWLIIVLALVAYGFYQLAIKNLVGAAGENQFELLARSFLNKQLFFFKSVDDAALFNGNYYWPLGPLPAVILMPFIRFSKISAQGYVSFVLTLANFILLYSIAIKHKLKRESALLLAFAYIFSTVYLFVATVPWSWYFAQVVATFFTLLALNEFFGKKRLAVVGIFIGLAVITRVTLILSLFFFLYFTIADKDKTLKLKIRNAYLLIGPIIIALGLLAMYNFLRFGSFTELGYHYQLLANEPYQNFLRGEWSFVHFPANIYYFLLKGPDAIFTPNTKVMVRPYLSADIWGMSILFTSPIFLYLINLKKDIQSKIALATSGIMIFALLGYYGIGVRQYGYRYALDFYPFLFIALLPIFKDRISTFAKLLIISSFFWNLYLIPSVFR